MSYLNSDDLLDLLVRERLLTAAQRQFILLNQAKQRLVQDVVEGGGEINLTEMSDAALMDLVKLDINAAGA